MGEKGTKYYVLGRWKIGAVDIYVNEVLKSTSAAN